MLFFASTLSAGNFPDSHPAVFKAYATLAAIKAVDNHAKTLELLNDVMQGYGNHSDTQNIAAQYRTCCHQLTKPGAPFEISFEAYNQYLQSQQRVRQFINSLPSVYAEICTFGKEELVSADCGLWQVKALLPSLAVSIESLASLVDDIQIYCAAKNPGEQFFTKIITCAARTFTTERIQQVLVEHTVQSSALTSLYTKNAEYLAEWALDADSTAQEELVSLKTTNPQWKLVGATRQSAEPLFGNTSGNPV